jgi:hypothetical protein
MDHVEALRRKIESFRAEIAQIHLLNERHLIQGETGTAAQVAQTKRHERLQEIQNELVQLSRLGNKTVSIETRIEKRLSRRDTLKRAS